MAPALAGKGLATRSLSNRVENILLSAAAGVMLASSFFSLLQPALDFAVTQAARPVSC